MQANVDKPILDDGVAARFGILKQRLLLRCLNEVPDLATHTLIIHESNEAAWLAWLTLYPLLTFPCLFEERAAAATDQARRQARLYWTGFGVAQPSCAA